MTIETSHHLYPPFPEHVTRAPLVSIALTKLEESDSGESTAFFRACQDLGFFYLNLEGSPVGERLVADAEKLHSVQQAFFELPEAEKKEYAREKIDPFFGYRNIPLGRVDEHGQTTVTETYNMRKDDITGNGPPLPMHPLATNNLSTLESYIRGCRHVIDLLITHLEVHLQLPRGMLANLHRLGQRSGDHVRFNKASIQPFDEEKAQKSEHTDFGSLTILFNWLGGLQIRSPDSGKWVYVKPVPGSPVVNLGDALVKFTAGILRSNVHRVVPAPSPQDHLVRHSLVYFSRPEDAVVLRRLRGGLIDAQPVQDDENGEEMTAEQWTLRRSLGDLKGVYTHRGGLELRT